MMRGSIIGFALGLLLFPLASVAGAQTPDESFRHSPVPPDSSRPVALVSRYRTIAHVVLRRERDALAWGDPDFDPRAFQEKLGMLDGLIDQARTRISYDSTISDPRRQARQARRILGEIEDLLVDNNFLLSLPTEYVHEMLSPAPAEHPHSFFTEARRNHYRRHRGEPFYPFDCDVSAFLYVAIGQVLGLPLRMVEVPRHNFVRWRLAPDRAINWDTNTAHEHTDDDYRQGRSGTSRTSFGPRTEQDQRFLVDLSLAEIEGYHSALTGQILADRGYFPEAVEHLERAISARPYAVVPKYFLAWLYVASGELKSEANHRKALELAREVDLREPANPKYRRVLACAYAATGDFPKALEIERLAYDDPGVVEAFSAGRTCLDLRAE